MCSQGSDHKQTSKSTFPYLVSCYITKVDYMEKPIQRHSWFIWTSDVNSIQFDLTRHENILVNSPKFWFRKRTQLLEKMKDNVNDKLCEESHDIDILILISSSIKQFNERQTIRKSWGSKCNRNDTAIKCLFVIGNHRLTSDGPRVSTVSTRDSGLREESTLYKDIVQIDYIDSYGNLTYKTVSSISWAVRYCASAKFVMKKDTDMYVNTYLLPFITKKAPTKFICGFAGVLPPHTEIEILNGMCRLKAIEKTNFVQCVQGLDTL
ncbi:unnamed protein product [Mytilus coruscus]|uniref:Hexosyltransferase n=1 Tax=Mytilus coruscus TaxID=42192 RepID=A0A6J8CBM9_MYTCO|nr:unnamed protein product [Mytilus coruscus]